MKSYPKILLGIIFLAGTVALASFNFQNLKSQQLSSDPYTNTTSQHKTEVEPDAFSFGSTIVSAFQVGRFVDGGASNIGWATSQDSGKTWVDGFLPGITKFDGGGKYDRVSDATVAYDASHKAWLVSSLVLTETGGVNGAGVAVSRSVDGLTWVNPVMVFDATAAGTSVDKNWTVCDNTPSSPFFGHCYTEWDDTDNGNLVEMSTSTDGGLTWSAPANTADGATGLGGQPLVQPNGTVIVPIADATISTLMSFTSTDGGKTWSATSTIANVNDHTVTGMRSDPLPSAQIDGNGNVVVVWQDCSFESNCSANDIVFSSSKDGVTWSKAQRIPLDNVGSGVDHFIPGLGIDVTTADATAHFGVTYYYYSNANCTTATCQLSVGYSTSSDNGTTWSAPVNLINPIPLSSVPDTDEGRMVGDYIATAFASGSGFGVYAAIGAAAPEIAMFAPIAGQQNAQFNREIRRIANDPVLSTNSSHPKRKVPVILL